MYHVLEPFRWILNLLYHRMVNVFKSNEIRISYILLITLYCTHLGLTSWFVVIDILTHYNRLNTYGNLNSFFNFNFENRIYFLNKKFIFFKFLYITCNIVDSFAFQLSPQVPRRDKHTLPVL